MKIYKEIIDISKQEKVVVLGNLDGVHRGHRQLIKQGKKLALDHHRELMVVTFYPQFQEILYEDFRYLTSQTLKMKIFEQLGVNSVLILPFTDNIAKMSPEAFIQELLIDKLSAYHIVCGFNYTFGYKGAGNADLLLKLTLESGVDVEIVPPVHIDGEVVNSTLIRQMLQRGELEKANKLLGYTFTLDGIVIHGHMVGRTIGIPTANLFVDKRVALPPQGVYAAMVYCNEQELVGVLNIGMRPTVDNGTDISIEVHILDFDRDIYGEHLMISICHWLRGEVKFSGLEQLKQQINKDIDTTKKLLAK